MELVVALLLIGDEGSWFIDLMHVSFSELICGFHLYKSSIDLLMRFFVLALSALLVPTRDRILSKILSNFRTFY